MQKFDTFTQSSLYFCVLYHLFIYFYIQKDFSYSQKQTNTPLFSSRLLMALLFAILYHSGVRRTQDQISAPPPLTYQLCGQRHLHLPPVSSEDNNSFQLIGLFSGLNETIYVKQLAQLSSTQPVTSVTVIVTLWVLLFCI